MYKLILSTHYQDLGKVSAICRLSDMTFIPLAEDNTDYQAYLKWVAEGNTPLPADEAQS
jgi:hypothetical protein